MKKDEVKTVLTFHFHQGFALFPIVLYVALSAVIMIVFKFYSMKALILASILALLAGFLLCSNRKKYWVSIVSGLAKYGNARLIVIFMVIGIFAKLLVTGDVGSGFIWIGVHLHLQGGAFTVFCFVVAGIISMGVGAPIAALLAVIPIFYPAGVLLGANPAILTGAIMSGVFLGDALSPSSQVIHTTIASQHDPFTKKSAPLLETMKERLPYLVIAGILSAVLFFFLGGNGGNLGDADKLASMCDPKGLLMIIPIVLLLAICFKTSDLFLGVTWAIIAGLIIGLLGGLFTFSDVVTMNAKTQELHGILFDGLYSVIDIIVSTILLYGLIAVAVDGGMMDRCCQWLISRKGAQSSRGAEGIISIGVGVVNVLLAGCVLPSILMFKDISDTIGMEAKLPATRRSILLTAMTTNITAIIPINSAFVMGAVTLINGLSKSGGIPSVSPFQIFISSFYCLLLTGVCILWVVFGMGRVNSKKAVQGSMYQEKE